MKIFGTALRRSLVVAATLAATAVGSFALTAPAQARDSFSFGYSDGRSGFSMGVNDHRGRGGWDRGRDRHDRWDRRDHWRHRDYRPRYYYPQRYRYVEPPPYYYYPPPRAYYYGY